MDKKIVKAFQLLGYTKAAERDEFDEEASIFHLKDYLEDDKFLGMSPAYGKNDHLDAGSIFSLDEKLVFKVTFDCFFMVICSDHASVSRIVKEVGFEGFYCNPQTEYIWSLQDFG